MGFGPLNIVSPRTVSAEGFLSVASNPDNQYVASIVGAGQAEAFRRGTTWALIRLEATDTATGLPQKVQLQTPDYADPPGWTTKLNLSSYDRDHAPLMFIDGIRIVVGAGIDMDAVIVSV